MPLSVWIRKHSAQSKKLKYSLTDKKSPEDIFLDYKWSSTAMQFAEENEKKFCKFRKRIVKVVKGLVKLRNELFNTYTDMKKTLEQSESCWYSYYTKQDCISM
mmetsp:Transcript_1803/g.1591  ORF Transcript_1803/g.1591 Transcript_1803/m.1591 type:complete len:103 (-) Transcript_1803:45-353(-)